MSLVAIHQSDITMADLPEPMTPPDCDLRDFAYMPLDVLRLRDSEMAALADPEAFRAAVLSWCAAWHQVPAASLPDNEVMLARLLGFGRDLNGFRHARAAGALRGWVKCSDGRLYHAVVAEKALMAYAKKLAQRRRTDEARKAKAENRARKAEPPPPQVIDFPASNPSVTDNKCQSKGRDRERDKEEKEKKESLSPSAPTARTADQVHAEAPGLDLGEPPAKASPTGTRLPEDWHPGDDGVAFAKSLHLNPDAVLAKFRDYWLGKAGKDGRKSNWIATWRNWCRTEAERAARFGKLPPPPPGVSRLNSML